MDRSLSCPPTCSLVKTAPAPPPWLPRASPPRLPLLAPPLARSPRLPPPKPPNYCFPVPRANTSLIPPPAPPLRYTLETVCGGWFVACALLTVMLAVKPAPKEVKAAE